MYWNDRWAAISARIEGLVEAGSLMASAFRVKAEDPGGVVKTVILPEMEAVKEELRQFKAEFEPALPTGAANALSRFIDHDWKGSPSHPHTNIQLVVPFAVFCSQFEFFLRDTELRAKSVTELAFEHLRRLLAVDTDAQKKWAVAFDQREECCERLGAVHLLSQGIWAFKVSGAGAATDLVFGEPIEQEIGLVRRTARALVLTEWKIVKGPEQAERKAEEAQRQTQSYARGILGDLELKSTRYIVLVSKKNFQPPEDRVAGSVTFRHVVLAIEPDSASREARQS